MKYFNFKETYFSQTAIRLHIDNRPTEQILKNIQKVGLLMDAIRQYLCKPIKITSWFRCLQLNRKIGSKDTSQHVLGLAVDFQVIGYSNNQLFELFKQLAKGNIVKFDQLIFQYNSWIHISISDKPRHQALIINSFETKLYET